MNKSNAPGAAGNGPVSSFPTSAAIQAPPKPVPAKSAPRAKAAAVNPRASVVKTKPLAAKAKAGPVKAAVGKPAAAKAKAAAVKVTKPAAPARAGAVPAARSAAKPVAAQAKMRRIPILAADTAAKDKARKPKLVRDSFTMPEQEYAVLSQVKKACLKAGFEIKKSELLRIGVALISQIDLATLQTVLSALPQLKTGRPKKSNSTLPN